MFVVFMAIPTRFVENIFLHPLKISIYAKRTCFFNDPFTFASVTTMIYVMNNVLHLERRNVIDVVKCVSV